MTVIFVLVAPSASSWLRTRCGEGREVARIDAHAAQFRSGHFDGGFHGFFDVVGVDQQRGVLAQCLDLRFKGVTLGIMHQREAMRGGADGLQTIQAGRPADWRYP